MLTIWGRANSVNVMKLLWLCEELALPYVRHDAGGAFGRVRDPDYLAMNPNGQVPVIVDADGTTLWESNACLRYLCHRHAAQHPIHPADPVRRGDVERWMDWQLSSFQPSMTVLFWTFVRTPEAQRDLPAAERARVAAIPLWAMLEGRLADGRAYLCGDGLTLADLAIGGFLHRWLSLPIARPPAPGLERWYAQLRTHAGYRTHMAVLPLT